MRAMASITFTAALLYGGWLRRTGTLSAGRVGAGSSAGRRPEHAAHVAGAR